MVGLFAIISDRIGRRRILLVGCGVMTAAREIGATGDQIALMFLIGGSANVVTGPQVGRLSDRIGRRGIILTGCMGLSIFMLATVPVVTSLVTTYVIFFLTMVLIAMRVSPCSALLTALVRDERRGSLMSLTVALGQMGYALGGAVAGPVSAPSAPPLAAAERRGPCRVRARSL